MLKTKKEQYFADEIWKINQDMFSDNINILHNFAHQLTLDFFFICT